MSDQTKESPADKLKREKAEQAALDAEKQKLADAAKAEEDKIKADEEALAAASQKAIDDDEPEPDAQDNITEGFDDAKAAAKHLETIALAYPLTTPDEHTVFGFGGHRFTLGQLRALFHLKRGR